MKLLPLLIFVAIISNYSAYSQIQKGFFMSKTWSKEISLYRSKTFVINDVLEVTNEIIKFQVRPLAAANSGELTTLVYDCIQKNKSGLILSFYGDYWNDAGVLYTGYQFKNIEKDKAVQLLEKLTKVINDNYKFLSTEDVNEYNLVYRDDDMKFLIYNVSENSTKIRVFWSGFDAEWDAKSLYKTQQLLLKFYK